MAINIKWECIILNSLLKIDQQHRNKIIIVTLLKILFWFRKYIALLLIKYVDAKDSSARTLNVYAEQQKA